MVDLSFFNKSKEHSKIKAEIVSKYLAVWAQVICSRVDRVLYVDLFAGPGRYEDGTKSTPLLVLEKALENPIMCSKLMTVFSDMEKVNSEKLEKEIKALPGINKMVHTPEVYVDIVDKKMAELFKSMNLIPTLTFLDPWGYKGLTIDLIQSLIKDWGSECIIFFNYNRINIGIKNDLVLEKGVFLAYQMNGQALSQMRRIPAAARRRRKRGCRLVKMGNEHPGEVKFDFFFKFCGCNPEFAR